MTRKGKRSVVSIFVITLIILIASIAAIPRTWDQLLFKIDRKYEYNRNSRVQQLETIEIMRIGIEYMKEFGQDTHLAEAELREEIRKVEQRTAKNYLDYLFKYFVLRSDLSIPEFMK